MTSDDAQERLEQFRSAMFGAMQGALDAGHITESGAATFYILAVVAARQTFFGEDFDEARRDEIAHWEHQAPADPRLN